jgi:hypothetical protein
MTARIPPPAPDITEANFAMANAVLQARGTPVLVDIDPVTLSILRGWKPSALPLTVARLAPSAIWRFSAPIPTSR